MNGTIYNDGVSVGQSIQSGFSKMFDYIPVLIGALLILVIGYFVSKAIAAGIQKLLYRLHFDEAMHRSAAGNYVARVISTPTEFVSRVVFWLLFLFFISMAASALQLPLLDQIVHGIYAYIPRVVSAILIFLAATAIVGGANAFVNRVMGDTPTAKLISTSIPVVTLTIASFMILDQLNIAKDIVNILFTAIVGAVALGMAIAFGLGGRDVAHDILQKAYEAGQKRSEQTKSDLKHATRNTKQAAAEVIDAAKRSQ